jgi:hypothetical protein
MRVEVIPSHDIHNFYLRWEIVPEGRERPMLAALGGPLFLAVETSCVVDQSGNRHETTTLKVPIWPFPGERNLGQARFYDADSRRRFWVNLQDAVGTTVVDWLFEARPGSLKNTGKDGKTLTVAEGVRRAPTAAPQPAPTA